MEHLMNILLTPKELQDCLPNATQEQLVKTANNLNNYINTSAIRINRSNKKKDVYKHLNTARKKLKEAIEALQLGKEGFSPEIYSLLIENKERDRERPATLNQLVNSISNCIPIEEPKYIEKKELEHLFEIMHLECEKVNPKLTWYSRNEVENSHKGAFFFLCCLVAKKLDIDISNNTIQSYLRKKSKKNRNKMKQVYKNIGDNVTLAKLWDEMDKLK